MAHDPVTAPRAVKCILQTGRKFPALVVALTFALSLGESAAQNPALAFDHASGFYDSAFRLTISTPLQGATIYFTTNGSIPSPDTGHRHDDSIPISTTTIVRAAVFVHGRAYYETARTFLFIPAILKQTGAQFPSAWGTNEGRLVPAHYEMSPTVTEDASRTLAESLRAIPSLSVITDPESLFSPETGIYVHPMERGIEWERPVNVEMFDLQGGSVFQINCGLRIHGGMSRRPEESPKHSFRLGFKRRYGPAKLRVPLFGPDGAQEFDLPDAARLRVADACDGWADAGGNR